MLRPPSVERSPGVQRSSAAIAPGRRRLGGGGGDAPRGTDHTSSHETNRRRDDRPTKGPQAVFRGLSPGPEAVCCANTGHNLIATHYRAATVTCEARAIGGMGDGATSSTVDTDEPFINWRVTRQSTSLEETCPTSSTSISVQSCPVLSSPVQTCPTRYSPEACSAAKYYFMTHAQCASSVCATRSATPQRRGYDVTT